VTSLSLSTLTRQRDRIIASIQELELKLDEVSNAIFKFTPLLQQKATQA
jgi:hypothetical protein